MMTSADHFPAAFPKLKNSFPDGEVWMGDGILWLQNLATESVDMIFADPPYNLGREEWDRFSSPSEYVGWCRQWIAESFRVLKPSGSMYICGFSEILADLKNPAVEVFGGCRWLVWYYRNKANMGRTWGRSHESLLYLRKTRQVVFHLDAIRVPYLPHTLRYPAHPHGRTSRYGENHDGRRPVWHPHPHGAKPRDVIEIPAICNGMKEKTPHPAQKPEALLRRLLLASTNQGDLVIDPFAGSGTTAVAARQLGRQWKICDLTGDYLDWAIRRLALVPERSPEAWIMLDRAVMERRDRLASGGTALGKNDKGKRGLGRSPEKP